MTQLAYSEDYLVRYVMKKITASLILMSVMMTSPVYVENWFDKPENRNVIVAGKCKPILILSGKNSIQSPDVFTKK